MTTAIIFPSLQHLNCNSSKLDISQEEGGGMGMIVRKKLDDKRKIAEGDLEREDECGICLESCTKMVFLIAATPCASIATMTGIYNRISYILPFPI